ncbi:MAG TPA: hypothetical protein VFQ84_03880 [Arenimonas sp.]|uniref:hypothetical protein n=1 Tax=Arenimonas sp. TaxID=1872635 RepID=UPI002D7E9DDF|nr:hypothetical protein [Arenimonas sp.]HEU0152468.1 hypothetical protein [Arenimonas sp.]
MPTVLRPLLLLAALAVVAPVQAREDEAPRPSQDEAPRPSQREDAGARVRQVERDGGRVLQAEPMQRGGRQVYRFKVLTPEGRVRVLDDARGREPARRDTRFDRSEPPRPGTLIRERPRVRSTEPAADEAPRPPRRDEVPRERD